MRLNLRGHRLDGTDALKRRVETKLVRLERHFDPVTNTVTNTRVVLAVEKLARKAKTTADVSDSRLVAAAGREDLYAALDTPVEKLSLIGRSSGTRKSLPITFEIAPRCALVPTIPLSNVIIHKDDRERKGHSYR